MRLQILDTPCFEALEILRDEFVIVHSEPDIVYTQLTPIETSVPVFTPCTGTDHVKSPKVVNLSDKEWLEWNVYATAEHTLSLILACAKNLQTHVKYLYWDEGTGYQRTIDTPMSRDLNGRRVLIVGNGRVGRQVGRMCKVLGMHVDTLEKGCTWGCVEDKLHRADVVSVHVPLEGNRGMVNEKWFSHIRDGTIFINTSRSGVVEESSLARNCGRLTMGLDVTEGYSFATMSKLNENEVLITPHVAGYSDKSRYNTDMWIVEKMLDWRDRHESHNRSD